MKRFSFLILLLTLYCEPIGLTDKMTGKEAKSKIAEAIRPYLLLTLLDAQSSKNFVIQGFSKYYATIDLLIPDMMNIDEEAYYRKKDVDTCADKVKRLVQAGADELAPFSCNLTPMPKIGL